MTVTVSDRKANTEEPSSPIISVNHHEPPPPLAAAEVTKRDSDGNRDNGSDGIRGSYGIERMFDRNGGWHFMCRFLSRSLREEREVQPP